MNIAVHVHDRILKRVDQVFAAVVDPAQMSHYFISKASAPLAAGATVEWEFADVGAKARIHVLEVDVNRRIVYETAQGETRRVTMLFGPDSRDSTVVSP